MRRERILIMGAPGTGKTCQIINLCEWLATKGIRQHVIDCEDKMEAFLYGLNYDVEERDGYLFIPKLGMDLYVANFWEELEDARKKIDERSNPNEWIMVDRIDLTWPSVQRYYTKLKYNEELAERLVKQAQKISKSKMFVPRFDQGDWQPVNETYDNFILNLLYKQRCNVILTSGIKGVDVSSPQDVFDIGILPRGQKELPHQPHSAFLLYNKRIGKDIEYYIITAKDIPSREYLHNERLFNFAIQYLEGIAGWEV